MKQESLLGIALELIETLMAPGNYPADARLGRFYRARRFLGSRERRFLGDAAYAWLRHFPRASARVAAVSQRGELELDTGPQSASPSPRVKALCEVLALAADGLFPWEWSDTLSAARGVVWPCAADERAARALIAAPRWSECPFTDHDWPSESAERQAAEMSLPPWLAERLIRWIGAGQARELAARLAQSATVDLRVNRRVVKRETVREHLESELGIEVQLTPWSPAGLRLATRRNLTGTRASREAWVEVADEGSQIVACALDAELGMTIVEACAGAGGKTLALADTLFGDRSSDDPLGVWSRTRLIACDVLSRKLEELERRASEAGVRDMIEMRCIDPQGPLPEDVPAADLVLVDAPCSGFGTLRRNPDLKLRYQAKDVARFALLQRSILERFLPLVKPGGRLAYATCSFLHDENEAVSQAFASAHPDLMPYTSTWATKRLPAACFRDSALCLDPLRTQTDAFYLVQWSRAE